jgi:hypothetical protein
MKVLQRQRSELRAQLLAMLERLRPGLWRAEDDGLRLLADIEGMERDGLLVPDGAALVGREHHTEIGQVLFRHGVVHADVVDRLRSAGWRSDVNRQPE